MLAIRDALRARLALLVPAERLTDRIPPLAQQQLVTQTPVIAMRIEQGTQFGAFNRSISDVPALILVMAVTPDDAAALLAQVRAALILPLILSTGVAAASYPDAPPPSIQDARAIVALRVSYRVSGPL